MVKERKCQVGVIGSGFIAKGLVSFLVRSNVYEVSRVLTRRDSNTVGHDLKIDTKMVTDSIDEIIDGSDLVVECSGDPIYATEKLCKVLSADKKIVTMDAETQVTTGSYLTKLGYITEAEGDQPGSLAALDGEARQMGFTPLVYGNIKGYLNHNPTPEDMDFWDKKNGTSLQQTISFTDGTKIQIEQALVANGLGATILAPGLLGIAHDDLKTGAEALAIRAEREALPVSDYLLSRKLPAGVFLVGKHDADQVDALKYFKMGEGPYYTMLRSFHLCHLEIVKTLNRVVNGDRELLNNSKNPTISVATVAKSDLLPGVKIGRAIGSFEARGIAIKMVDYPNHVPIGLVSNAVVTRKIETGKMLEWDDLELPDSVALKIWVENFQKTY